MIHHEQLMRTMWREREAKAQRHQAVREVRLMRRAAMLMRREAMLTAIEAFRYRTMALAMSPTQARGRAPTSGETHDRVEHTRRALVTRLRCAANPPTCAY